ncbi:MAG: hypothetical protein KAT06_02600 [Gammaproteobacteria bacterium]|nr:hypothetical protein [Gammaproteobacteria bacterium]
MELFNKIQLPLISFILYITLSIFTSSSSATDNANGFSMHGNWCGPNYPKDVNNADDPIDKLDQQCKTHDLCYVDKGEYDCSCDRAMVLDIDKTQKNKIYNAEQYLKSQNIKIHFALSPCNGEIKNNKALPTRILTNIYKKTKNRTLELYERFSW